MGWRKGRLKEAQNFALYYGSGREEILSRYDLVVVEPAGHSSSAVKKIQEGGTLVLAYLSVMEISPWAPEYQLLREEDFLSAGGRRLKNESFGTSLVDLRSKRWKGLLHHRAGELLLQAGYDGLFLDTIGDVEFFPGPMMDVQMRAAVNLINELKKIDSDRVIVQNNGLLRLCLFTAELIDGICWENPPLADEESLPWAAPLVERLRMLRDRVGLKVLLLLEEKHAGSLGAVKKAAGENGFLYYLAANDYLGI